MSQKSPPHPDQPAFQYRQPIGLILSLFALAAAGLAANDGAAADVAGAGPTRAAVAEVAPASDEPAESMSAIRIEPEWRIDLFAAEPEIANIVAFDIDNRGRVFVCETFRQNRGVTDNRAHDEAWVLADLAAETVQDRIDYHKRLLGEGATAYAQQEDRIRRLVDEDGDGRADASTIFADGFHALEEGTGAGVLAHGNDVYYTCIPKLWRMTDLDDDGVADEKAVLSDGYGVRVAFRGHDLHGLTMGYDGRLYFSIGDRGFHISTPDGRVLSHPDQGAVFRCELDGSDLTVFARGLRNPQELAFNDYGDWFSVDNNSDSGDKARIVQLLRGGDSGWRMYYQYLPDRGPFGRQKIWEPHRNDQPAHLVPPIANFTDGPSGLAFYPGTGFGDTLKNRFLICDFRGGPSNSGIRSFELNQSGAFYSLGENDQPLWNVLATDVAFGPGGELLVSDWVDGWDGLGKGRIYRLTDPSQTDAPVVAEVRDMLAAGVADVAVGELASRLAHADRRVRLAAQWELAKRGEVEPLIEVALNKKLEPRFRLHGYWGAEHAVRLNGELRERVLTALRVGQQDASPWIRAAACSLAADQADTASIPQLVTAIEDKDSRVSYHAMMALADLLAGNQQSFAEFVGPAMVAVQARIEENANQDPALRHAAIRCLAAAAEDNWLVNLQSHRSVDVRRAAVAALRNRRSEKVAEFLSDADTLVIAEAAMAIHDAPIPVAQERLAELISKPDLPIDSEPLLRRVLSAGFRIGTPAAAAAIAEFAASDRSPEWARIEAIDSLADWSAPGPLCRVTNKYSPLPPRPVAEPPLLAGKTRDTTTVKDSIAKSALTSRIDELMLASDAVREKAIDVGSTLGIVKIAPNLVKRFTNKTLNPATRAAALTALARLQPTLAIELAREIDLQQPNRIVLASLSVLGRYDAAASIERLIVATGSSSQPVRGLAWDLIASNESPRAEQHLAVGLQKYLSGELPSDVRLNVAEAARRRLPASAAKLAEHEEKLKVTEPLAPWFDALDGGDADAGKDLFFGKTELSCVRCHQVDRVGGEVGPSLTTIGKTLDRRQLLEAICLPNARIAEGFETAVIADEDGTVFTGIVAAETDDLVELIAADGTHHPIEKELIVARKKGLSSMPLGLADLISARELRDLVAYLASLQIDPRGESEVE
ncbi:PVC-type heme-binding CxxCH protein [Allorhodopirellula heiligendammensis]|uniref:Cytochrome c domain-containing protein n=1 Tax=Allorhodopirellula heiligendammensis TaxID=2714739 RepID=A0A5C6BTI0_9BACT|nr:PVC-type heme-binding CxxCH protein [Allorhodopirellula heiligendammensis]TWU15325.1 hypothetical protein Poly21_25200 [Allorhodopirellula heiligendammensis]